MSKGQSSNVMISLVTTVLILVSFILILKGGLRMFSGGESGVPLLFTGLLILGILSKLFS